MPSLISPLALRAHVETGLTDGALQQIIDAEEADMVRRYGDHATITEQRFGGMRLIALARPASVITTVVEDDTTIPPDGGEASDYYRLSNRITLERVGAGYWGSRVTITYTPLSSEVERRSLVLVNLCKLHLAYSGYSSQGGADLTEAPLDLDLEREKLFRQLRPRHQVFA